MPFRSKAQMRFMFAKHPSIAKRWEDTYGVSKNMPEHVGDKPGKMSRLLRRKKRKAK